MSSGTWRRVRTVLLVACTVGIVVGMIDGLLSASFQMMVAGTPALILIVIVFVTTARASKKQRDEPGGDRMASARERIDLRDNCVRSVTADRQTALVSHWPIG